MKTQLPLPEHDDYRIVLPDRVCLHEGTAVELVDAAMTFRRNEIDLSVTLPPSAGEALRTALDPMGAGLSARGLAPVWRGLMDKLACAGMLHDADPPRNGMSALGAVAAIADRIHRGRIRFDVVDGPMSGFLAGEAPESAAMTWLFEQYHFTKSAVYHITPVLGHPMSDGERALWTRFLEDEAWHWRIYRPALAQFGLDFDDVRELVPAEPTRAFIEAIRAAAQHSPVAYAAAMTYVETPPPCENAADHPVYGKLMQHYGYSAASIRPLWWHQRENVTAGHSDLGSVVLTNRRVLDPEVFAEALSVLDDVVCGGIRWMDEVIALHDAHA
jgi:hypothetical protein